jgi:hypothetical protein
LPRSEERRRRAPAKALKEILKPFSWLSFIAQSIIQAGEQAKRVVLAATAAFQPMLDRIALSLEAANLFAYYCELLLRQLARALGGRLLLAQLDKRFDLTESEPVALRSLDESQECDRLLRVISVSRIETARPFQQPEPLVHAHRLRAHPGLKGNLSYSHFPVPPLAPLQIIDLVPEYKVKS